jgi:hypothetical protein
VQGHDEQEAEGDSGPGAELCQLQPAAAQGAASRAQQLCRSLSGMKSRHSVLGLTPQA